VLVKLVVTVVQLVAVVCVAVVEAEVVDVVEVDGVWTRPGRYAAPISVTAMATDTIAILDNNSRVLPWNGSVSY
jgi:hypothetical protein